MMVMLRGRRIDGPGCTWVIPGFSLGYPRLSLGYPWVIPGISLVCLGIQDPEGILSTPGINECETSYPEGVRPHILRV